MKKRVYLAGPITGCVYEEAVSWRYLVSCALNSPQVECVSPMRGMAVRDTGGVISAGEGDTASTTRKGITRRDMWDAVTATCLFVYLKDAPTVSIGTVMEIAWAYLRQIPSIVVVDPDNIHAKHVMIQEAATYMVPTMKEGIALAEALLNV